MKNSTKFQLDKTTFWPPNVAFNKTFLFSGSYLAHIWTTYQQFFWPESKAHKFLSLTPIEALSGSVDSWHYGDHASIFILPERRHNQHRRASKHAFSTLFSFPCTSFLFLSTNDWSPWQQRNGGSRSLSFKEWITSKTRAWLYLLKS